MPVKKTKTVTRKRRATLKGAGEFGPLERVLLAGYNLSRDKNMQNTINSAASNFLNQTPVLPKGSGPKRKTQRGGFRQTHAERQLWLATTPDKKAYWRDQVQKEKALAGGSIKDKLKTAGMIAAPVVATALMGALAHKLHGNHVANKAWDNKLADRMDYYKRNNIM